MSAGLLPSGASALGVQTLSAPQASASSSLSAHLCVQISPVCEDTSHFGLGPPSGPL